MMRKRPAPPVNPDRMQKPVPGWSLTQPRGKWPWEQPPRFVEPEQALDFVLDRLEDPDTEERFVKLMFAGVSIEEVTEAVARGGFMEGFYTPDVAEILKPSLGIYLMGLAEDNDIPVNVFANPEKIERDRKGDIDDVTLLEIMKRRNPEFADFVLDYRDPRMVAAADRKKKMSQGFLGVDEEVVDEQAMQAAEGFAQEVFDEEDGEEA